MQDQAQTELGGRRQIVRLSEALSLNSWACLYVKDHPAMLSGRQALALGQACLERAITAQTAPEVSPAYAQMLQSLFQVAATDVRVAEDLRAFCRR